MEESARGPRSLDKQQQYALQRAIEKDLLFSQTQYPKRWFSRRRDASLVLFLLHTGLRVSEVIAMKHVDVQMSARKGQITVRGKGQKQRGVPLNTEARRALQDWLEVRPDSEDEHVWVNVSTEAETGLSVRSAQRTLTRYGRAAGIEHLTPHTLRHSFAKNLVDASVGLEKVAALLGHSNLNTTRVYVTPSEKDLEKAVEQVVVR